MAPEVIQEIGYTYKADIWSLGITAIELAEIHPPNYDIPPERFIFMIPSRPPPTLKNERKNYSQHINDFLTKCLDKEPTNRLEAWELLNHSFVQNTKSVLVLEDLLQDMNKVIESSGGRDKAFQLANEKMEEEQKKRQEELNLNTSVEEKNESDTVPNMEDLDDDDFAMLADFNEDDIQISDDDDDSVKRDDDDDNDEKPLFMQYFDKNPPLEEEKKDVEDIQIEKTNRRSSIVTKLVDEDVITCEACGLKIKEVALKALGKK